jgi:two-component system, OmpR family, sensor histidine kinase KdpD
VPGDDRGHGPASQAGRLERRNGNRAPAYAEGMNRVPRLLVTAAAIAAATGVVYALRPVAPDVSLGVVYVLPVMGVAIAYGVPYAIGAAVASMLVFNFLFLPPLYTFSIRDSENWVALGVYLGTGIVVSELAARAKRRAVTAEQRQREARLLAEISTYLLEGRRLDDELGWIGQRTAEILDVREAEIILGEVREPKAHRAPHPLLAGTRQIGTLYTDEHSEPHLDVRRRFLPALASLLTVAAERERLEREALEAEALRRSDTVKTAILRAVSHDLRSPLTAIATATGTLTNNQLSLTDADRRELLESVEIETHRLSRLVANLLDMSRLEAGAAAPEPELWTVDDLVRQAIDDVDGEDRVQVSATDAPPVRVDAAQIERVLANLLENALKFSSPEMPVQVRVTTTRSEVIVRVVDQGPGIPTAELERVFEAFYRQEGNRGGGAGLGLAIARGFAEANGARLWAESRPGQGATFALALPAVSTPVEVAA